MGGGSEHSADFAGSNGFVFGNVRAFKLVGIIRLDGAREGEPLIGDGRARRRRGRVREEEQHATEGLFRIRHTSSHSSTYLAHRNPMSFSACQG